MAKFILFQQAAASLREEVGPPSENSDEDQAWAYLCVSRKWELRCVCKPLLIIPLSGSYSCPEKACSCKGSQHWRAARRRGSAGWHGMCVNHVVCIWYPWKCVCAQSILYNYFSMYCWIISLSIYLSMNIIYIYIFIYIHIDSRAYTYLSAYLSIYLFINLPSVFRCIHL